MESLQRTRVASNETHLDHLGLPTFGIGHLVVEGDPEHGQFVGTAVDEERVRQVFSLDIASTLDELLYPDFDELPEEAQLIIATMFNMQQAAPVQVQGHEGRRRCQRLEPRRRRDGGQPLVRP